MNLHHEFGTWLRQLRSKRDLTQEALAEAVGCATQTVRSFEVGRRRPSREMAARLANILALPNDEAAAFVSLARAPLAASTPPASRIAAHTPPTQMRHAPLSSLPHQLIGRHHDHERLRRALLDERHQLVTLLGPGGVGKTSLALQTVGTLAHYFADTAVVALASVTDLAGVIGAIATAVGCPLSGVVEPQIALLLFLRERNLLLLLDNLEHLLSGAQGDSVASFLHAVLHQATGVTLLVTSRERLRLHAEAVVEIGGLHVPADDRASTIARSDAVLLFLERARRVSSDFALGPHNQEMVAQICRRLDGLPLALELAAAQVSFLPPATLLARLDQALPLLEGGARDLPARQRTMRATIAWSYHLLSADERQLFERLGVFVSSWSLQAAEAIGMCGDSTQTHVLGLLRRLVDQSLVVRDEAAGDDVRYRLLEPVRQYALEQLETHMEQANVVRHCHAIYFAALAGQLGPLLRVPQDANAFVAVLARIEREYPNIRTAVGWLLANTGAETVAQIGWSLFTFWWYRSQPREPRAWMEATLLHQDQLPLQSRAHTLLALLATSYGGAPNQRLAVASEAIALFEYIGDSYGQAHVLIYTGLARLARGDDAQAVDAVRRAYDLAQSVDDVWLSTEAACILGLVLGYAKQYVEARHYLEQSIAVARANRDTWNEVLALFHRALLAEAEGDAEQVAHFCRTWLVFASGIVIVNGSSIAYCLESLAVAAAIAGQLGRAARLFGATDALRNIAGTFMLTPQQTEYARTVTSLRQALSTPELAPAWAEGRALNMVEAVEQALETYGTP